MELNDAFVNTYIKKMKETVDDLQGRLVIAETKVEILDETVKERDKQVADIVAQFRIMETDLHVANEKAAMAEKYGDVVAKLDEMTVKYEGTLAEYDRMKGNENNYRHVFNQKLDEIESLKLKLARFAATCPACFEEITIVTPEDDAAARDAGAASVSEYWANVGHIVTTPGVALVPTVTTLSSNNSGNGSYWNETVVLVDPKPTSVGMEDASISEHKFLKPRARPARTNTKK